MTARGGTIEFMSEELIGATDIRGEEQNGLTVDVAWNIGKALAEWLPTDGAIVVAYVPTHHHMAEAVIEGVRLQGRDVVDAGHGDASAIISHITTAGYAGGAVIGFNEQDRLITIALYDHQAQVVTDETGLQALRDLVEAGNFVPSATKGQLLQTA